jgi:hypothetical protein
MVFCIILWTFGTVRGNLVYFSRFGILYKEKSGNPGRPRAKLGPYSQFGDALRPSCVQCDQIKKNNT